MLVYLPHRLMVGLVEENKIRTCTILTHHLYRLNKCFSGTEPSGLVVSDRENIQGRHHLTSLRVRWISVAAASSGSASPTVDENYRSVRVTTRTPSVKNSTRFTIVGRIRPNKIRYRSTKATHLIEVLQELYICDRQRNRHQQKSGCELSIANY